MTAPTHSGKEHIVLPRHSHHRRHHHGHRHHCTPAVEAPASVATVPDVPLNQQPAIITAVASPASLADKTALSLGSGDHIRTSPVTNAGERSVDRLPLPDFDLGRMRASRDTPDGYHAFQGGGVAGAMVTPHVGVGLMSVNYGADRQKGVGVVAQQTIPVGQRGRLTGTAVASLDQKGRPSIGVGLKLRF